jgi:anti-sigma factor RsiW
MNCKQVREQFFDLASAPATGSPAVDEHLRACGECAAKLTELRQTMSLLDEWRAPEPSPYFNARLRARLRDEVEAPRTLAAWLRDAFSPFTQAGHRVVLAACLMLLMVAGVSLFQSTDRHNTTDAVEVQQRGTAVADLQTLDKNKDLYADFDLLDDVQVNP